MLYTNTVNDCNIHNRSSERLTAKKVKQARKRMRKGDETWRETIVSLLVTFVIPRRADGEGEKCESFMISQLVFLYMLKNMHQQHSEICLLYSVVLE